MPAATITRTTPWVAATTFRQCRGGNGPRIQGRIHPAAMKAYRIAPIASTQPPTARVAYQLSTRRRNASTSMSKRAPTAETVPVRRATLPSTASSASATEASATSAATGAGRLTDSTVRAATPPTSVARASVTRSAGPSGSFPRADASAA
jgi:hypothetical protein